MNVGGRRGKECTIRLLTFSHSVNADGVSVCCPGSALGVWAALGKKTGRKIPARGIHSFSGEADRINNQVMEQVILL